MFWSSWERHTVFTHTYTPPPLDTPFRHHMHTNTPRASQVAAVLQSRAKALRVLLARTGLSPPARGSNILCPPLHQTRDKSTVAILVEKTKVAGISQRCTFFSQGKSLAVLSEWGELKSSPPSWICLAGNKRVVREHAEDEWRWACHDRPSVPRVGRGQYLKKELKRDCCPLPHLAGLGSWWWTCTYPVPFHAHTHFLATICGTLVFDVASQAVSAPPPLRAVTLFQNLYHLGLVNGVNSLQGIRSRRGNRQGTSSARKAQILSKII